MNTTESTRSIASLISHVVSECTRVDREAAFDEMLNECYSFEKVGGPFEYMQPSAVLAECDPTAYRCGVNDFADGEPWTEVEGDTYRDSDIEEARQSFVDDLNSELAELERKLNEEREKGPDGDECEIASLEVQIGDLEKFIHDCENHTF